MEYKGFTIQIVIEGGAEAGWAWSFSVYKGTGSVHLSSSGKLFPTEALARACATEEAKRWIDKR